MKNDGFSLGAQRTPIKENDISVLINFKNFYARLEREYELVEKELIEIMKIILSAKFKRNESDIRLSNSSTMGMFSTLSTKNQLPKRS